MVIGFAIALGLYQHRIFAPRPAGTTGRIMRIPVVHVVTPFSCEVGFLRVQFVYTPVDIACLRMGELDVIIFASLSRCITGGIAVWIRIFLVHDALHLLGKIVRIPGLVEDRLPKPYARAVAVASDDVSDVVIHEVGKARFRIPKLPSRSVFYYE